MQHRMKTHSLDKEQIETILHKTQTGCIATINPDGTPYVTPIHFVYVEKKIYFHGLPKGQKIDNIKLNPNISLTVYEVDSLSLAPDENPCHTSTKYQSAIISGTAKIIDDSQTKKDVLAAIIKKYTPHLNSANLPDNAVNGTAVIEIITQTITGKYCE